MDVGDGLNRVGEQAPQPGVTLGQPFESEEAVSGCQIGGPLAEQPDNSAADYFLNLDEMEEVEAVKASPQGGPANAQDKPKSMTEVIVIDDDDNDPIIMLMPVEKMSEQRNEEGRKRRRSRRASRQQKTHMTIDLTQDESEEETGGAAVDRQGGRGGGDDDDGGGKPKAAAQGAPSGGAVSVRGDEAMMMTSSAAEGAERQQEEGQRLAVPLGSVLDDVKKKLDAVRGVKRPLNHRDFVPNAKSRGRSKSMAHVKHEKGEKKRAASSSRRASTGGSSSSSSSSNIKEEDDDVKKVVPLRSLPMRSCHRPDYMRKRASMMTAMMSSKGASMLDDPLHMPSIRDMVALLPSHHVWYTDRGACEIPPVSIENQLETYKSEGYSCMTHDTVRNRKFNDSITWASRGEGGGSRRHWLEVGTGADAVLTLMVLRSCGETDCIGIEVNEVAVRKAKQLLAMAGMGDRSLLIEGLSTYENVIETAREFGPFDAIVHELIGLFAGCEGAAYLLQRLKTDYNLSGSVLQIPCAAATLFAPVLVCSDDFNAQHFNVYCVRDFFCLVKRVGITEAQRRTLGSGKEWMKSGVVEFIDFTSDEKLNVYQERNTFFVSETDAYINALVCWIWVETSEAGAKPRDKKTAYPYGACAEDAPPRSDGNVAFSSRADDGDACAANWRNLLIPLRQTFLVPKGVPLEVATGANLREPTPSYHIVASCQQTTLCERHIRNFAPIFTQ